MFLNFFKKHRGHKYSSHRNDAVTINLMTGQLAVMYTSTNNQLFKDEYLRRLIHINFSEQEANRLWIYETNIIKSISKQQLLKNDYIMSEYFNLITVLLPEKAEYYIEQKTFLCSEITKIWDEAEFIYAVKHECNLSPEVWSEIYRMSRYGGAKLFMEYICSVSSNTQISEDKIRNYCIAEQKLLHKYKWYPERNIPHPYE